MTTKEERITYKLEAVEAMIDILEILRDKMKQKLEKEK